MEWGTIATMKKRIKKKFDITRKIDRESKKKEYYRDIARKKEKQYE